MAITAQAHTNRAGQAETGPALPGHACPHARPATPETRRLYAADRAAFSAWCLQHGETALPATPVTVIVYLQTLVDRLGAGALVRRVAAINDPSTGAKAIFGQSSLASLRRHNHEQVGLIARSSQPYPTS